MKLELKHFNIGDEFYGASDIWRVTGYSVDYVYIDNGRHYQELTLENLQAEYSLLRRPLSDLTKEIEINGENRVLFNEFSLLSQSKLNAVIKGYSHFDVLQYRVLEILIINRYDVFGLIPKGLAIDINTL